MILKPTFYCWIKGLRIEKQAHHSFPDCRVSPVFILFNTHTYIHKWYHKLGGEFSSGLFLFLQGCIGNIIKQDTGGLLDYYISSIFTSEFMSIWHWTNICQTGNVFTVLVKI